MYRYVSEYSEWAKKGSLLSDKKSFDEKLKMKEILAGAPERSGAAPGVARIFPFSTLH